MKQALISAFAIVSLAPIHALHAESRSKSAATVSSTVSGARERAAASAARRSCVLPGRGRAS